jgi:hypothetical protein
MLECNKDHLILGQNPDYVQLLQVWSKSGKMVYERWTKEIVRISHISDNILLFVCPEETKYGPNGTVIYIVKLDRFGDTKFVKLRI